MSALRPPRGENGMDKEKLRFWAYRLIAIPIAAFIAVVFNFMVVAMFWETQISNAVEDLLPPSVTHTTDIPVALE
jgi:hypothetical protein